MYDTSHTDFARPIARPGSLLEESMRLTRSHVLVASASLALGLALPTLIRAAVTLPYSFQAGTVANASQVNANFTTLASAIDAQDTRLTATESVAASKVSPISANHRVMKTTSVSINRSMGASETYTQVFNYAGGCHATTAFPILASREGGGNAEQIASVNPIDRCSFRVFVHRPGAAWPNMTLTLHVLSIGD